MRAHAPRARHGRPGIVCLPAVFAMAAALFILDSCSRKVGNPEEYRYVIGVSQANFTEPWRISMKEEITAEAAHYPDLRVVFTDASDSSNRQIRDVQRLRDSGVDLLIISPTDSKTLTPVIAEVYGHLPVIILDRAMEGYDYTLYIGPDNVRIGKQAGEAVVDMLAGRPGKVLEIQGRFGSPPVKDRSSGFMEAIKQAGNIQIVDTIIADWLRDKAEDKVAEWLAHHPPVDVIFAQNDAMALGASRAVQKLGISGIKFVGIDGLLGPTGGIELVKNGVLDATFTCPTGGKEAVQFALDILRHAEGIPKRILLRSQTVTRTTIANGSFTTGQSPRKGTGKGGGIVLGFVQVGAESIWRRANTESIKNAARQAGIELVFEDGQQRQEIQVKAIRSLIDRKVDIIAFSPIVESGYEQVLREAKAAGIPVILTDRAVDISDESLLLTFMGSDFVEEGRRAAQWLVGYMNTADPVNIVELQGTIGSAPAIDRKIGFEEVLRNHPNYVIIRSESGAFFENVGYDVMRKILTDLRIKGLRVDALWAHNDDMAFGAIEALKEFDYRPGKNVIIVSVDAGRSAFKAMIDGTLNCTVECNPLLGPQLMKAIKDYMDGKELPFRMITSESVFPAENARRELSTRKY
jgi:ABC-type sugar transport system substrate-binding protein